MTRDGNEVMKGKLGEERERIGRTGWEKAESTE